jgi:hypothetical protein
MARRGFTTTLWALEPKRTFFFLRSVSCSKVARRLGAADRADERAGHPEKTEVSANCSESELLSTFA